MLDFMHDQVDNPSLSDLCVRAAEKSFQCHRAVLAASSPVFAAMFTAHMREKESGLLILDDVSPHVFATVRDYMYGKPLVVHDDHAIALSAFVRQYDIGGAELSDFLDSLLTSALTLDNVLNIRAHADAHSAHRLLRSCDRYLTTRMNVLPQTAAFLSSTPTLAVVALQAPMHLSSDSISRKCSQFVFVAALAWLAHDLDERHQYLDLLLDTVDVNALSLPALVRASREPIAMQSKRFESRLLRAFVNRAERGLNFGPTARRFGDASSSLSRTTGFAIVDDSHIMARTTSTEGLDIFSNARASMPLYHIRRRSSLGEPWRIYSRFPRRTSSQNPQPENQ